MRQRKSRPAKEIRAELIARHGEPDAHDRIWVPCHNCGGTGRYPSSVTPSGRCRFYCWQNKVPCHETLGVKELVAQIQRNERRAFNDKLEAERREAEQREMATVYAERAHDERVALLVADPSEFNLSLLAQFIENGDLSEKQWAVIERKQAERAGVATADFNAYTDGERVKKVRVTFLRHRNLGQSSYSYYATRKLYAFRDESGTDLATFTDGTPLYDAVVALRDSLPVDEDRNVTVDDLLNTTLVVSFTVKKRGDDFKGRPSYVVNRLKVHA